MPRIQQLPPAVVTKIAAGEVIERPASVLKELLENSIDAGSTRIEVDVIQGGAEALRVVDDGCGIEAEDLPLAFASHATSKLASTDDLFRISTMGFRGEALASIGGVAQVTLQSRPAVSSPTSDSGAELTCHGGALSAVKPWNGAPGTRIEVRHLFFNTPVRRKFMRSTPTELGHISEIFTRIALAQPHLQLTLRHNGKDVYEVPASAGLLDRLGLFFGKELRTQLYPVERQVGPVRLSGFIGDPSCERGSAKLQYLFLNGRWIRDRSLGHALQEAYRGLLMTGRYAVAFLFLDVPPDQVDVNVHPTKAEVRFRDGQFLYHLVLTGVRDRLRAQNLTPRLRPPQAAGSGQSAVGGAGGGSWSLRPMGPAPAHLPFAEGRVATLEALPPPETSEPAPAAHCPLPTDSALPAAHCPLPTDSAPAAHCPLPTDSAPAAHCPLPTDSALPAVPKVLQLYDSYLVLESPEGMLVIDQHALHERILFEQFKQAIRSGPLATQRLLIPEPIDLPAEQAARALEQREALAELGFLVEDFGGGTVLLTGYPAILGQRSPVKIFGAAVDHLVTKERLPTREVLLNDMLSLMACHAAVRAGDRLRPEEIQALLAQRHLVHDTHHCPHGRPTSLVFSRHELERQFRRV